MSDKCVSVFAGNLRDEDELYDYTVEVVQRIVKEAEVLNITVPEKMRKVRL